MGSVFAETALSTAATATGSGSACRRGLLARPSRDGPGASADQTFDVSAALRASIDDGIRHLLPRFKTARAFVAKNS